MLSKKVVCYYSLSDVWVFEYKMLLKSIALYLFHNYNFFQVSSFVLLSCMAVAIETVDQEVVCCFVIAVLLYKSHFYRQFLAYIVISMAGPTRRGEWTYNVMSDNKYRGNLSDATQDNTVS